MGVERETDRRVEGKVRQSGAARWEGRREEQVGRYVCTKAEQKIPSIGSDVT